MGKAERRTKAFIDSNLFISGTILRRGTPFLLLEHWRSGLFNLVTSPRQIAELVDVMDRPKVRIDYGVTQIEVDELPGRLQSLAISVSPTIGCPIPLRDPNDEFILASAIEGEADVLVTGDKDLLSVAGDERLGKLRIVSAAVFLSELGETAWGRMPRQAILATWPAFPCQPGGAVVGRA
jgi:putative PIN family toxin of toxin-antitoxin system